MSCRNAKTAHYTKPTLVESSCEPPFKEELKYPLFAGKYNYYSRTDNDLSFKKWDLSVIYKQRWWELVVY